MKNLILNRKKLSALLIGVMMGLVVVVSGANAQGPEAEDWKGVVKEMRDESAFEEVDLNLPAEIPSVTFINKEGEVVAVLHGDKAVLEETYTNQFSRSYFLSASGLHEVYLIK